VPQLYDNLLRHKVLELGMYKNFCYLCNAEKLTRPCPTCGKPACKDCMKSFPFSNSVCLECASGVKTRLAGIRNDEEIF
jgi:hypothetical protein